MARIETKSQPAATSRAKLDTRSLPNRSTSLRAPPNAPSRTEVDHRRNGARREQSLQQHESDRARVRPAPPDVEEPPLRSRPRRKSFTRKAIWSTFGHTVPTAVTTRTEPKIVHDAGKSAASTKPEVTTRDVASESSSDSSSDDVETLWSSDLGLDARPRRATAPALIRSQDAQTQPAREVDFARFMRPEAKSASTAPSASRVLDAVAAMPVLRDPWSGRIFDRTTPAASPRAPLRSASLAISPSRPHADRQVRWALDIQDECPTPPIPERASRHCSVADEASPEEAWDRIHRALSVSHDSCPWPATGVKVARPQQGWKHERHNWFPRWAFGLPQGLTFNRIEVGRPVAATRHFHSSEYSMQR